VQRLASGPDRIERVGLRAVAPLGSFGSVELDHDLLPLGQVSGEVGSVAAGAFDCPNLQGGLFAGQLHQLGVALGGRVHGDLAEDATSSCVDGCR
jgi:hypothetical protein